MSVPGFVAEASLFRTSAHFRTSAASGQASGIRPAWIFFQFPEIQLSWQPSNVIAGQGNLTVTGDNFAPDVDVMLTISNCSYGGIPCRTQVHTSKGSVHGAFYFPGGTFRTTITMFCGGDSTVKAVSLTTPDQAQATTNMNC